VNALTEFAGERVQHLAPRAGNGHRRALGMQSLRDGAPDTTGRNR